MNEANLNIDLRKIFANKNPKLAPFIPGFIYTYLNHVLHIREINDFLKNHGDKKDYDFISAIIEDFKVTTTFRGQENLPSEGRFIFASNHPLGGFDGMILLKMLIEKYGKIKSISNDILLNIKNMEALFLPINKHGSQSMEVVQKFDEIMASDIQILTFPAGLVSRRNKGIIRDVPWKKSFITKSIQFKRDIIPIHITGRCTNFFYNFANFRKFLGIKSNLEMFFLVDETFRHRNKHFVITIGPPISWQTFDKSKKPQEWAIMIQDYIYTLETFPFQNEKKIQQ